MSAGLALTGAVATAPTVMSALGLGRVKTFDGREYRRLSQALVDLGPNDA
jgi:hypothetical protein